MSQLDLFREIATTYRRHGWRLERALMTATTLNEFRSGREIDEGETFETARVIEAAMDALWFARASAGGREAWELRLVAETPYALFELFESDEAEEDREDVRREMEARMSERAFGV